MPNITFDFDDFRVLAGGDVSQDELEDRLPYMGCDMGGVSRDGTVEVEFFPDRPDLFCVEGAARAFRAFTGRKPGLPIYEAPPSGVVIEVDPSVSDVRPYVVCAVLKNVDLDDNGIRSLMDIQEKLHLTMGRKRAKVSIGVHDPTRLVPPFVYKAVAPDAVKFLPLDMIEELDPADILRRHPKGQEYGVILDGHDTYPLIVDRKDQVLSFPPIINGELTRVTDDTRELFIDVTGTDYGAVHGALAILTSALVDRGAFLQSVEVRYPDGPKVTPDFTPVEMELSTEYVNRILGKSFSDAEIAANLERSGMGADPEGDTVRVRIPAYRLDILHPVDLVEDVAVGFGYDKFEGVLPSGFKTGSPLPRRGLEGRARILLTGLGFTETMSLTLSSEDEQFVRMHRPLTPHSKMLNPITVEHTILRNSLIPSLLSLFRVNKHRDLPQNIYELGPVVDGSCNRGALAFAQCAADSSFTRGKSLVRSLLGGLGIEFRLEESLDEAFIRGRCAEVWLPNCGAEVGGARTGEGGGGTEEGGSGTEEGDGGRTCLAGVFGEIHPRTLEAFELRHPVVAAELDMEMLLRSRR